MPQQQAVYAVYKGDKFITVGTAKECARELGIKTESVQFKSRPSYKKRVAKRKGGNSDAMIVIRLDEEDGYK